MQSNLQYLIEVLAKEILRFKHPVMAPFVELDLKDAKDILEELYRLKDLEGD